MKNVGKIMIMIGMVLVCIGLNGCSDSDDSGTTTTFPLDLRGTYSVQGTLTPVSGDCSWVSPPNSGRVTFAQSLSDSFTLEDCEVEMGPPCKPSVFTGIIEGDQVTINLDDVISQEELNEVMPGLGMDEAEVHISITGTVTDTSQFMLSGSGTFEPGGCFVDTTATFTQM